MGSAPTAPRVDQLEQELLRHLSPHLQPLVQDLTALARGAAAHERHLLAILARARDADGVTAVLLEHPSNLTGSKVSAVIDWRTREPQPSGEAVPS